MKTRALTLSISMCLLASSAWAGPTVKKRSWVTESATLEVRRIAWGVPFLQQAYAPRLNCRAPEVPLITNVHAFPKAAARVRDRGGYGSFDSTRLGEWRVRVVSTNGGPELQASATGWAAGEANAPAGLAAGIPFNGAPGGYWLTATFADNSGVVIDDASLLRVNFTVSLTVACGTVDFGGVAPQ
jgi:hypothetical protein